MSRYTQTQTLLALLATLVASWSFVELSACLPPCKARSDYTLNSFMPIQMSIIKAEKTSVRDQSLRL